ncbi:hypothetical protein RICGR_0790 [Rickettsiella grylli]|uniref:Uncharacterized protein n=1 Tax=Rickettsiella grylli TaxID=59196 RepID=A8PMP4_9COXI|nr:hypothetical protein RICGR_0790 [Rickettsiella grylli]
MLRWLGLKKMGLYTLMNVLSKRPPITLHPFFNLKEVF